MPIPLNGATTSTGYTDAATLAYVYGGRGGRFTIESQPVYAEIAYGAQGAESWTAEQLVQPGSGSIDPGAIGIRFRSSGSQPATVSASITPPMLPGLTLLSQGTVGVSMVTGRVSADGSIAGGTGFTVNPSSTGTYVLTFSPALTATAHLDVAVTGANQNLISWVPASASQATVRTWTAAGAAADVSFSFTAVAEQ